MTQYLGNTVYGFVRFQQLIINNTGLVPPNTQHNLRSVNIRLSRRRRSMTGQSPWISSLWVAVMNPFFITRYDAMKKTLPFSPLKQLFTGEKTTLSFPWLQIIRNPSSLFLNHSQRMQSLRNGLAGNSWCRSKLSLRLARILIEQCLQFSVFKGFWPSFTRTVDNTEITNLETTEPITARCFT